MKQSAKRAPEKSIHEMLYFVRRVSLIATMAATSCNTIDIIRRIFRTMAGF